MTMSIIGGGEQPRPDPSQAETLVPTSNVLVLTVKELENQHPELAEKYREAWVEYAQRHKWPAEETDYYDDPEHGTLYLFALDDEGELLVGVRMTPVETLGGDCMSMHMWDSVLWRETDDPEVRAQDEGVREQFETHTDLINSVEAEANRGNVYDITRLVTMERRESIRAIVELIGAMAAVGGRDENESLRSYLLFTTEPKTKEFFDRSLLPSTVVAQGIISPGVDTEPSLLCVAQMAHVYETVRKNPKKLEPFSKGYDRVSDVRLI